MRFQEREFLRIFQLLNRDSSLTADQDLTLMQLRAMKVDWKQQQKVKFVAHSTF